MSSLHTIAGLSLPWMYERTRSPHLCIYSATKGKGTEHLASLSGQILAQSKPGTVRFQFIDHAELGGSFRAFAALRDASVDVIGDGIASTPQEIRSRLAGMVETIAAITQQKLRDTHQTLDDYNAAIRAGSGAAGEPYRFVIISNWPHGFDTESCQLLSQILVNGAKCGIYVVGSVDTKAKIPYGVELDDVWGRSIAINLDANPSVTLDGRLGGTLVPADVVRTLPNVVARYSAALSKVRLAPYDFRKMITAVYSSLSPPLDAFSGPWSTTSDVRLVMPIGLAGGERIDSIIIGESGASSAHNILVLGPVGSGKSNLLHVMIQSLLELYGPEDVRLYLVDGKYGTEFSRYERHRPPHVRVVSLNSDTAFGLSVLREIYEEQGRRGERFTEAGARDLKEFRAKAGTKLPRIVLFLDEFQLLLSDDDRLVSDEAKSLLSKIAKQGRAYGIHLVLATQTLRGVDLPRDVQDQTAIRIVLGRSPDGFHGVLDPSNRGAEQLEKLHALKNVDFGHHSGNSTLQVAAALSEEEAERRIAAYKATWSSAPLESRAAVPRVQIFKGNEPAALLDSTVMAGMLEDTRSVIAEKPMELLVGEPVAVRDTHALPMYRRPESNVLMLSRSIGDLAGTLIAMLLSALTQRDTGKLGISVIDMMGDESDERLLREQLNAIATTFESCFSVHSSPGDGLIRGLLTQVAQAVEDAGSTPPEQRRTQLLVVLGLQEVRALRDDPESLIGILDRGPSRGVHVICWVNSLSNLRRVSGYDWSAFGQGVVGTVNEDDASDIFPKKFTAERNRLATFDKSGFTNDRMLQIRAFARLKTTELASILGQIKKKRSRSNG